MADSAPIAGQKSAPRCGLTLAARGVRRYRGQNLDTAVGIRRELGRLYREARAGRIDPGDATKLAYVLLAIVRVAEAASFDERLDRLERTVADRRATGTTGTP